MSIQFSQLFDNISNFTYSNTEISGGVGKLSLISNPAQVFEQTFTSSSGFTFDAAKAEFTGGKVQQIDQRPAGFTFISTYKTSINGNWGGGVLTGTAVGGASIVGEWLDCTGGTDKYVRYAALGNASTCTQTGTFKTMYRKGSGSLQSEIFSIIKTGSAKNLVSLTRMASGIFKIQIYSNTTVSIVNYTTPGFTDTGNDELEFFWDITTGYTGLRMNGVLLGVIQTATGTRDSDVDYLKIGGYYIPAITNASFKNSILFPTVQHVSDYTPGYSLYETIYIASKVDLPLFTYSWPGSIQALTGFTTTETDAPRYSINSKYWSGSAWVTSNGTYSQASSKTDINTNIGTLTIGSTYAVSILFTDINTQASIDLLDILYTGQQYNSSGWFKTVSSFTAETLLATYGGDVGFLSVKSIPTNTVLKYAIEKDGILYYWSGSAIAVSDGSESKTNTEADILSNILAFVTTIQTIKIYYYLKTTDTTITPTITSNKVAYDFGGIVPAPTTCIVWGYYRDINGIGVNDATVSFTLKRNKNQYKEASSSIIEQNKTVVTGSATDPHWADGYFEMELIRSSQYEGSGKYYLSIAKSTTLNTSKSGTGQKLEITVPDQVSVNITSLITAT